MLRKRLFFGLAVLALAGGIAVFVSAQARSNGPKSTHTTTAPKAGAPSTPKAAAGKSVKTAQPTTKAQHPSPAPVPAAPKVQPSKPTSPTKTASAAQPTSSPAKTQKIEKTAANPPAKPAKSDKAADTKLAKVGKPAPTTDLTPVQQKLKQNTNLAAKLATRLPQGTDVIAAAAGFKNLGQFVAAANVSQNLQISFTDLKAKLMTGMSLGQAIQAVRPLTASPTVEAQRAEYDARGMIYDSEQTSSTTATAPSTTSVSTPVKAKAKTKNSAQ